jgi:general secretion pathway protein A
MYERFFQLTKTPFSLVSDPDYIHLTDQHESVIRGLAFGVLERRGYLTLTGEAGLGKTTALRALSEILTESNVQSSVILTPTLTSSEFLELLMLNFGIKEIPVSKARRLKLLEDFLIRANAAGRLSALIVDEAHQLSDDLLEEIRLLGNFEAADHKLLQIVLAGHSEFDARLNLPQLWHLKQRIAIRLSLRRLNREAIEEYIQYRWSAAGGVSSFPCSDDAMDAVAAWSCGIPRLINTICDNALLIAFSETIQMLDVEIVREACIDLTLPTPAVVSFPRQLKRAATTTPRTEQNPLPLADQLQAETPPYSIPVPRSSFLNRWRRRPHPATGSKTSIFSLNEPVR